MGKKKDEFTADESPLSLDPRAALRARTEAGDVLSPVDVDARGRPGFDGDKAAGQDALADLTEPVSELQERLFAESRGSGTRAVLLVLQGMDTSGKGGVIRKTIGLVDPCTTLSRAWAVNGNGLPSCLHFLARSQP